MPGKQSREIFLAAVAEQAQLLSKSTGIPAADIQFMLITNAALEGGAGETTGAGDGGKSIGRYQFHTGGGVGTTLLNQGWTMEDFLDDQKVVEYWAPIVVGEYQKQIGAGNGGPAGMREAIFKAERPFEMYSSERWNGAVGVAGSVMGDQVPSSAASSAGYSGGMTAGGGELTPGQQGRSTSLKRLQDTFAAWDANPTAENETAYFEASRVYEEGLYVADAAKGDDGSDALADSIALGDYERRGANDAFDKWLAKEEQATTLAIADSQNISRANEETRAQEEARSQLGSGGPVLRGSGTYHYPQAFDKVLEKYRGQIEATGAGAAPPRSGLPTGDGSGSADDGQFRPDYDVMLRQPTNTPPAPGTENPWDDAGGPVPSSILTNEGLRHGAPPEQSSGLWEELKNKLGGWMSPRGPEDYDQGSSFMEGPQLGPSNSSVPQEIQSVLDKLRGWGSGSTSTSRGGASSKTSQWYKPPAGYADGVIDAPGGRSRLGERGPEIVQVPGMPDQVLGQDGPIEVDLPKGSNVIPMEQAKRMAQIRQAREAKPPAGPNPDTMARFNRANDPELKQKVEALIRKAAAGATAMNPPATPVLMDAQVKDRWAEFRPLTGVPAYRAEEGAKK